MHGAIVIDPDRCKGCGLCILACPVDCLSFGEGLTRLGYRAVTHSSDGCRLDGLCVEVCPEPGAIEVARRPHALATAIAIGAS